MSALHLQIQAALLIDCFASGLCGQLSERERAQRATEIYLTISLLFTAGTRIKESIHRYEKLQSPKCLQLLGDSKLGSWKHPKKIPRLGDYRLEQDGQYIESFCWETREHLTARWSENTRLTHTIISYSDYLCYAGRLRKLRCYMDSQQPRGLAALWINSRHDSSSRALWCAGFFGALSFMVTICALGVAAAQTWGQFHLSR